MPKKQSKKSQLVTRFEKPLIVRGLVFLVMGFASITAPSFTLQLTSWGLGLLILADSIPAFILAIRLDNMALVADGVFALILGMTALFRPDIPAETLLMLIGVRLIGSGLIGINVGSHVKKVVSQRNMILGWSGIVMLGGIGLLLYPSAGLFYITLTSGLLFVSAGAILFKIAYQLQRLK